MGVFGDEIEVSKLIFILLKPHHVDVVLHRYILEQLLLLKEVILELSLDIVILHFHLFNFLPHSLNKGLELDI